MGSCDYLFTEPVAKEGKFPIGEQSTSGHIEIVVTIWRIHVKATVDSIKYTVTKDSFLCPFNGTGAKTGGTYNQSEVVPFESTNGATIDVG